MTLPDPDHVTASADLAKIAAGNSPATVTGTRARSNSHFPRSALSNGTGPGARPLCLPAGFAAFADAWLLVVPALLPLLYLAPWSGRVFFDEFDLLLLCSLAAALWHGGARIPGIGA